tara:strand:- start:1475 stop:3847 length:2373 start_codon:yes stop_codon:yes gene_type:complete
MAVSPADFYTYAKETGTPVAKSREEQAALYPAVNQWKRSRLSIPRTESKEQYLERNDLGGLETAATIGGIIGAGLLGRRYLKNVDARVKDAPTATKAPTQSVEEVINKTANLGDEAKYVRTPVYTKDDYGRTVPTDSRGVSTVDLDTLYKEPIDPQVEKAKEIYIVDDPVLQRRIKGEEPRSLPPGRSTALEYMSQSNMIDPETAYVSDIAAENPLAILKSRGDEQINVVQGTVANPKLYPQTTSEVHRQRAIARSNQAEAADTIREDLLSDQSINALGSAEDQDTGRVIQQLQRDPEIDQTKAALLEEMFEEQDRKFAQGLESGEIAPGREYVAPIDKVAGTLPDGAVVLQAEKRVGIAKEQDFVQQALDKVRPAYAEELTAEDLGALRGIDKEVREIRSQDQPKFYEDRNIDTSRIANAPKIKTGTVLDNLVGNLPAVAIAADEVARRGAKDIGDTVKGVRRVVVENAPSNLPDFSTVDTAPKVQTTDGTAVGPLYPFKQFVRGLTGDESVDIIDTSDFQDELLNTTKSSLTQSDLNKMNQVGITGTRLAGPSNVQSIRNNQTLTRQGPVPEVEVPEQTIVKSQIDQRLDNLQQETAELKAISENLGRAGQLMTGGTRAVNTPGTTTFDNAMASGMVTRAGIQPRITNPYYQRNISLPKTMREVVNTGERDPGRVIDTEPKGGGGRKVTAYNPDYQQLSTIGPYGIERANYPRADITKRPTEMPISPRTGKPIQEFRDRPWPPSSSPEVAEDSIKISEDIRRIYSSNRPDAQQQVQAYLQALRQRKGI